MTPLILRVKKAKNQHIVNSMVCVHRALEWILKGWDEMYVRVNNSQSFVHFNSFDIPQILTEIILEYCVDSVVVIFGFGIK